MNIWEYRAAKKEVQARTGKRATENDIFDVHRERTERLERVLAAQRETLRVRRAAQQKKHHAETRKRQDAVIGRPPSAPPKQPPARLGDPVSSVMAPDDGDDVFEDLDS